MMDRLWVKLLGAFVLVIGVGVLVTVLLSRQGAATQIDHFMLGGQMVSPEVLQQDLADYYRQQDGWQGLDVALSRLAAARPRGMMGGMMGSMMGSMSTRVRVADGDGRVVADTAGVAGVVLSDVELRAGIPIVVDRHQVGTLLIDSAGVSAPAIQGDELLAGVTRAVLVSGLVAGVVALLLAGLLVRQITRPLAALSQASRRIAAGDLAARVVIASRDELGQVAGTFNQMAASLQTQETLRRNLMADLAHELRTPLTGIQGTVEALQDGVFPLTPENLTPIHEQATMLTHLVEDLRTLANVEAGQLSLDVTVLDLAKLVRRQTAAFQPQALTQGVELRLELADDAPAVQADEQRLGQVLANLIGNALRHTPADGQIRVRLQPVDGGVQLSVVDSGEGIPTAALPHIFDRFYRADRSRNRATGGSGLGLAIARQLVAAHGGRIWVESPPTNQVRGSAFHVFLPAPSRKSV